MHNAQLFRPEAKVPGNDERAPRGAVGERTAPATNALTPGRRGLGRAAGRRSDAAAGGQAGPEVGGCPLSSPLSPTTCLTPPQQFERMYRATCAASRATCAMRCGGTNA